MIDTERFAAWQPAMQEYFDIFVDGRADEYGYFFIVPFADLTLGDSGESLIIGHAGDGVNSFGFRQGRLGLWSYNAIEDEWTWLAPTIEVFWRGWSNGTISV